MLRSETVTQGMRTIYYVAPSQIVASGAGLASESQGKVTLNVALDLRAAKTGAYFLATIRGADNGTYYYPLKVN